MNKPLHKDPSFWIVAVVLVVAADLTQLHYGLPWFANRVRRMSPAPRVTPQSRPSVVTTYSRPTNPAHGPEEWQLPYSEPNVLETAPPQVTVVPTKFQALAGGWGMSRNDKAIGIRISAQYLLRSAYKWNSNGRMILPSDMPTEQYDFIANLPSGAMEALQEEIRNKLGLVAELQTIQTNAWALRVDNPDAPGLKPFSPQNAQPAGGNAVMFRTIPNLISFIESFARAPTIDQTGLTGTFDIQFPIQRLTGPGSPAGRVEQFKSILKEQLGLDLIETNAPVEMLVVKKVN